MLARPGGHRDPQLPDEAIDEQRITTLRSVPSMLQVFLSAAPSCLARSRRRSGTWCAAARRCRMSLKERCLSGLDGVTLDNMYGPTEAAIDVTATLTVGEP